MKSSLLLVLSVVLALAYVPADAQSLPVGSAINISTVTCPSGFLAGTSCTHLTIHGCPGAADLGVTSGYKKGTNGQGTVALFPGSNGTTLSLNGSFATDYSKYGFDVEEAVWDVAWEGTKPQNIFNAACREATLINYQASVASKPFRLQGKSAGSAAIAYSLVWYQGIAEQVSYAILLAGPPLANMELGCEVPYASTVTVEPTNGSSFNNAPQYVPPFQQAISTYTGIACLPSHNTTTAQDNSWAAQSIVQPGQATTIPTALSGYVCNNGLNNTAAMAQQFYYSLTNTTFSLTAVTNCSGAEGVEAGTTPQGIKGQTAIEEDMESH